MKYLVYVWEDNKFEDADIYKADNIMMAVQIAVNLESMNYKTKIKEDNETEK